MSTRQEKLLSLRGTSTSWRGILWRERRTRRNQPNITALDGTRATTPPQPSTTPSLPRLHHQQRWPTFWREISWRSERSTRRNQRNITALDTTVTRHRPRPTTPRPSTTTSLPRLHHQQRLPTYWSEMSSRSERSTSPPPPRAKSQRLLSSR